MRILQIEAPWETYAKKLNALFENDPDIQVGEIRKGNDANYAVDILVHKHDKFDALDRLLPRVKMFGNVTLEIVLYDEENTEIDILDAFKALFDGNPIVNRIETVIDQAGGQWNYVVFRPEVIQFFDDDMSDINSNFNGLAEDISREIFAENSRGIMFCTDAK